MARRRERTPEELTAENATLRRRVDRLKYERDLERRASGELIQALRNTLSDTYLRKVEQERTKLIGDRSQTPPRPPLIQTWEDAVRHFTYEYESLANHKLAPVEFREIVLPTCDGWTLREDAVDWWPLDEVARRTSEVRGEVWFSRYESRKGIELTAEFLWGHRADAEAVATIWLSAFLAEHTEARREAFGYELVQSLQALVPAQARFRWHHAMRNLAPWDLLNSLSPMLNVRQVHEVVDVIAATAALAMSTNVLIHFVQAPSISPAE